VEEGLCQAVAFMYLGYLTSSATAGAGAGAGGEHPVQVPAVAAPKIPEQRRASDLTWRFA
jgi:hypothetical protein